MASQAPHSPIMVHKLARTSSFLAFAQEQRGIIKQKQPDISFEELHGLLSSKWRDLPEKEKQVYSSNASPIPSPDTQRRSLMQQSASAPTLPKTDPAFHYYSTHMHETVKKQNPGLKFYQIYTTLFDNWRNMPEWEKKRYEKLAAQQNGTTHTNTEETCTNTKQETIATKTTDTHQTEAKQTESEQISKQDCAEQS
eukprot:Phypoly_transcript_17502.p1 GENE.Phypoly_transcript_17502~~Phypoly_transcript_17502.p1  ORF type:complete len:221 (+),score=39.88 Phypoly_transcript_17502:76-663(+)